MVFVSYQEIFYVILVLFFVIFLLLFGDPTAAAAVFYITVAVILQILDDFARALLLVLFEYGLVVVSIA